MRKLWFLATVLVVGIAALLPGAAALATQANNESATYEWHLEVPNVSQSGDGDTASVTGMGQFSVHPKTASGGGQFTLTDDGTTITGTYEAIDTISFHPYGCGVLLGEPIEPNLCGGVLKMRVVLTPDGGGPQMKGILRIICIIGDTPGQVGKSNLATEGIELRVPGVDSYNKQVSGMNVFVLVASEP
jgi:hypothetical protein